MIASVLFLFDYSLSLLKRSSFGKLLLGQCSSPRSSFRFEIPTIESDAVIDQENSIRFRPPVYVQRYSVVSRIFQEKILLGGCKKIVDFGCAEIALFNYVKQTEGVEEYIAVDIDEELIRRYSCRVAPLVYDYLCDRDVALNVKVLCGSVADPDVRLLGADVVVAIELIEHLYPQPLEDLPYNIFGIIQPDVVLFTTPNSDFNVLFRDLIGFRHDDHKFEWSRQQFHDWADNLTARYPNYEVEIGGIGRGPDGTEHLGCSTQIAVFFRKGDRLKVDRDQCREIYKEIRTEEYPFRDRTKNFENDVKYYADTFIRISINAEDFLVEEEHRIPFGKVIEYINLRITNKNSKATACDESQIWPILKDLWNIVDEPDGSRTVIVPYTGLDDDWSISSQASSDDRSLVTDLDFRARQSPISESEWDAEPESGLPDLGVSGGDMSDDVAEQVVEAPPRPSVSVQDEPDLPVAVGPQSSSLFKNINHESQNGAQPLPKCHSLEQINPKNNKSFRFSLNMEKQDPFSCDISGANSECNRDKSVPSFSESFGLRLEDSCSQSKAVDSGYPNSFGQDMDMDLTPEQVDEIITETESSFDGDDESSGDEMDPNVRPDAVPHAPPLRFLDNVENGDVANNNRDGEGNNMEDNRLLGEALEFVQDVMEHVGDVQHANMAAVRVLDPDVDSDDEGVSNTVDGSSQADSTLPMLDEDTIQKCLADRGIALVLGDAPSSVSGSSPPRTPFNSRNPSIDQFAGENVPVGNSFPFWLRNILIDDYDEAGAGDVDTLNDVSRIVDDDVEVDSGSSIEYIIRGDDQGGGDPYIP